jgi:hypothetical protein
MAKFAATNYKVTINGTDFSTSLNQVELALESDDLETTAFGGTFRERIGGLKTGSLTLQFMQDFAASSVDATLFPLINTLATVVITPTSGSVTATNPSYTALCLVNSYSPHASSVGDLATFSITWPTSGTVTRATA